ncbi:Putative ribose/galactose/methyl galactoside import ATP-binding protein 3 [Rubellimicrobium mesophilum DSM 19309]|uniref:Putative ribose/galactose/methyl galactoside import ATP-binding protein 3 n=1 Tax=Rubellimicrobium mesophilum DSM 19309 TaxID=442562 RepID=A0A017HSN5_9RHOB|nr:Putative ribose/galactose/methyl galactoside import ATP-binding protein 3 [Rubellimicrobium mesophilum DSM 19309]
MLEVEGLSDGGRVRHVSLTVRAGEIVGLTGLVGAGRTEVAQALFGLAPRSAGSIRVRGVPVCPRSPAQARRAGLAYVPEDRKRDGIAPNLSVRENITLPILSRLAWLGTVRLRKEQGLARQQARTFGISPADPERRIATLSGGNQQKAVIARWLATQPAVLILDEPTRGVDVGAKAEIHAIIGDLVAQGLGVLMISSELPEVMAVSDRVYVMHEGRIAPPLARGELSEARIMELATGEATA